MEDKLLPYIVLVTWNFAVFLIYGLDKLCAKREKRRVSERTLLLLAALMGSVGALFGMYVFRHKTKHIKFTLGVPFLLLLQIAGAVYFFLR